LFSAKYRVSQASVRPRWQSGLACLFEPLSLP
jgi:hypothetical protein